jgi:hypothetical protein
MFRQKLMPPSSVMIETAGSFLHIHESTMCHTAEDRNQLNPSKVCTEKESEIFLR